MDNESIQEIVDEIAPLLTGRAPGKIFHFDTLSIAIDFGLRREGYLFVSVEPQHPRLYLIQRRVRDLEKLSRPLGQFPLTLRKELSGARLESVSKDREDRIVRFCFAGASELGEPNVRTLVAQLTGRSANLFLLDKDARIIQMLRSSEAARQRAGEIYHSPETLTVPKSLTPSALLEAIQTERPSSASAAADAYFTRLLAEKAAAASLASKRSNLRRQISQKQKLLKQLESDLQSHAGGENEKRMGDLLLANVSTAKRAGGHVILIDYFSEGTPSLEIQIDESRSLQEEAARRFTAYQKSKRAIAHITSRIAEAKTEVEKLEKELLHMTTSGGVTGSPVSSPSAPQSRRMAAAKSSRKQRIPGTRRYVSSDGLEILVGRAAKDNDNLTFKIAKPNDTWLHAADYGGSHVVVRNPTRKPVPQRTLIEAAQLAAYFSQAKKDPKVDVNYTERKFVSKPKGSKPGLVRLQRFKSITVEPKEAGTRQL